MINKLKSVRGTKDIIGEEAKLFNLIIKESKTLAECYGFEEIFTPIIEFTEVFKRTLGDYSDVVNKETYSFQDRGKDSITLRPEFTAAICRSFISNGLQQFLPLKLFTYGPLFRYERPQKGRQRQFHQINFEFIGSNSPYADVEIISLAANILKKLEIFDKTTIEINSLGCFDSRKHYQKDLVEFLQDFKEQLSHDSKIRLEKNPLRILDSKDENDQKIISKAPKISEYLTNESKDFFDKVLDGLNNLDIKYKINTNIVRGLDYYNHTIFEFTTDMLGAQNTILAGGRYDNLIETLGGPSTPAIGFASGIERLMLLINKEIPKRRPITIISINQETEGQVLQLVENLRTEGLYIYYDYDSNSVSKKMKKANKYNAKFAIFIGENELNSNQYKIKNLDTGNEQEINKENLLNYLINNE